MAERANESDPGKIEFRVREITRYVVTRYVEIGDARESREIGTYSDAGIAYDVAYAMAKADHESLGWAPGDERIQYPDAKYASGSRRVA